MKEAELETLKFILRDFETAANNSVQASADKPVIGPEGRHMTKAELNSFGRALREKNERFGHAKRELSDMRAESLVLQRTEQTLKSRVNDLEGFLQKQEENAGVIGYRDAKSNLELASEQTADLNKRKGETLEEISAVVARITNILEQKKVHLEPKVSVLLLPKMSFWYAADYPGEET